MKRDAPLQVFPVTVPPLRERMQDIPLLVWHFVEKYARRMNKQIEAIPQQAMEALQQYSWPGNIRELQNFIERTVILSSGRVASLRLTRTLPVAGSPAPSATGDDRNIARC